MNAKKLVLIPLALTIGLAACSPATTQLPPATAGPVVQTQVVEATQQISQYPTHFAPAATSAPAATTSQTGNYAPTAAPAATSIGA